VSIGRNIFIGYQSNLFKKLRAHKKTLMDNLIVLRSSYTVNFQEIPRMEGMLQKFSESEIESCLQYQPLFEHINGEKMTPRFLGLVKNSSNPNDKLSNIMQDDGRPFQSAREQEEYIVQFFEKIYVQPPDAPQNFEGLIERFLGPEILNNPIVINSELNNAEAEFLDEDLTVSELDISVQEAKLRSAGGKDGFSNAFIKKFWHFFRYPLHNYALTSFREKRLTENFSSASVRLIPKKGDSSSIKNWRPISLLNCFYKVVSRAVNNRLKKVSDKFTSRAQKGFTKSRYIQEVILNITNSISFCRENNISGCIVSIDLAKAFDTIYQHLNFSVSVKNFST
jgi:Reverse transcriptase (RNA-dependent DNA polymerase)